MNKYFAYALIAMAISTAVPASANPADELIAKRVKPAIAAQEFIPDGNMPRVDVPDKYKWDITPLFANHEAFEKGLQAAKADIARVKTFKGKLNNAEDLCRGLQYYFATRLLANRLTLYANLANSTNLVDPQTQRDNDLALAVMNQFIGDTAFIRDELLNLDEKYLQQAYSEHPKLVEYKGWIDQIRRRRDHVLSPKEEALLSAAGDNQFAEIDLNELPSGYEKAFQAIYSDLQLPTITDENGKTVQLTWSNYSKYRASNDRRVRRETVEKFFAALSQYKHAFAATMSGQVEFTKFLAKSRNYANSLDAYLDRDNIDPAVYKNLVSTIRANTEPLHRYVRLRKQLMGLDDVHIYDLYVPMVQGFTRQISFEQAREILPKALSALGPDYTRVLIHGLNPANGWVDVYPHKDKDSGASCASLFGVHPFVKMNYYNESDDMSTLAHEYGHALHSQLSFQNQPYATSSYTPFVAEVASTCNEKLLSDYLLKNTRNDRERLFLLNEMVDTIRTTIYRQTLFADFELQVHQAAENNTPITADLLNGIYRNLLKEYYGPDFTIDANDDIEWAYIPHLYYKYYVFTYATGLSSGIAIANNIEKNGAPAQKAYLKMLSSGSSKPPIELLRLAGVDLTKPDAIKAATDLMNTYLDDMEATIARLNKKAGK